MDTGITDKMVFPIQTFEEILREIDELIALAEIDRDGTPIYAE